MNLGTTRALRGPNIWSQQTVLEVEIDLSAHIQRSTQDIAAIRHRAAGFLTGLASVISSNRRDEASDSQNLSPEIGRAHV